LCLFRKILVPIDGSEHSLKALEEASQIARISSGKITLINVYSVQSTIGARAITMPQPSASGYTGTPVFTGAEVSRIIEAVQKSANKILQDAEQRVSSTGVHVEKMLVEGHTVQEIVRAANEGNFDLIVIGARGISRIREMLLGSVTDGVVHHAHCAVLVIK
jgi:nucleotide-binding universal stress UspA family protein